ncbi:MAG: hypothetical protein ACI4I7_03555 [Oscillospiraceae bacterium]
MDIQVISKSCAKITITRQESENLNIQFDNFQSKNPETKKFLTCIFAVLNEVGIIRTPDDKISVEVFEQENGDMIIYISASYRKTEEQDELYDYVFIADSPEELFDFSYKAKLYYPQEIKKPVLYSYRNRYFLFFSSPLLIKELSNELETKKIRDSFEILPTKAKEYGTFMCNTPFEKLI